MCECVGGCVHVRVHRWVFVRECVGGCVHVRLHRRVFMCEV